MMMRIHPIKSLYKLYWQLPSIPNSRFERAIIIMTYDYDPLEPDEYQHFFSEFDHIFFAASPL